MLKNNDELRSLWPYKNPMILSNQIHSFFFKINGPFKSNQVNEPNQPAIFQTKKTPAILILILILYLSLLFFIDYSFKIK